MEILYLDGKEVKITEEAESLDCIKKIKSRDRSEKLLNFQNVITGVYFIYKPGGMYENLSIGERKQIIYEKAHITKPWSEYEDQKIVKEFIDVYTKTVLTPAKKFLEKIKQDMDEFIEYLSNIPMEKILTLDQDITFEHEGEKITKRIQKRIKVSNADEKTKAYNTAIQISNMYEKQKTIVMQEELKEKAKKAQRRSFDKRGTKIPFNV